MPKNDPTTETIHVFDPGTSDDRIVEGLRLVKAFMQIHDPLLRVALVDFAERIADPKPKHLNGRAYS